MASEVVTAWSDGERSRFETVTVGLKGNPGAPGKSAYEVAVRNGFIGTEEEWLASLVSDIDEAALDGKANVIGDTFSGPILVPTPASTESSLIAPNTAWVRNHVANSIDGHNPKNPARFIVTSATPDITTGVGLMAGDVYDGLTLVAGDRFLRQTITGSTSTANTLNGIYEVKTALPPDRTSDANEPAELKNATVMITAGSRAGTFWVQDNTTPNVGTGNIIFFLRSSSTGAVYSAGTLMTLDVTQFNVLKASTAEMTSLTGVTPLIDTKAATPLGTETAVRDGRYLTATSHLPFVQNATRAAKSNKERWSNTISIPGDWDCDMSGTIANFHTALDNAIQEAKARNRAEIRVGHGTPKLGGTLTINGDMTGTPPNETPVPMQLRIVGAGDGTSVQKLATGGPPATVTGSWIHIGGVNRTTDITFEGFRFQGAGAMTSGEIFYLEDTSDIAIVDCSMSGVRRALLMGADATKRCSYTTLDSSPISPAGAAGAAVSVILLVAGGAFNIKGTGRHNGNGDSGLVFIEHASNTTNWDGLYVYDQFFEQYPRYLYSHGNFPGGIVNVIWKGGQCDRVYWIETITPPPTPPALATIYHASTAFAASPNSGTPDLGNRAWDISNVQLLNPLQTNAPSTSTPRQRGLELPLVWNSLGDVNFMPKRVRGYSGYVSILAGTANIQGINFYGSGHGLGGFNVSGGSIPVVGQPLIRFRGSRGIVQGNVHVPEADKTPPTIGLEWLAPVAPDVAVPGARIQSNNIFVGCTSTVSGSP